MKKYNKKSKMDKTKKIKITGIVFIILGVFSLSDWEGWVVLLSGTIIFFSSFVINKDKNRSREKNVKESTTTQEYQSNQPVEIVEPNTFHDKDESSKNNYLSKIITNNLNYLQQSQIKQKKKIVEPVIFYFEDENRYLKYYYKNVNIASQHYDLPESISVGDFVELNQEPENEYDPNAISVYVENIKIGYMYKGNLQSMCNDWLKKSNTIIAQIDSVDLENKKISLFLAFYDELKEENIENKFRFSISDKKYEEDFSLFTDVGSKVRIFYDGAKDKYAVEDYGYAPKSATKFFDDISDDCVSFVYDVEEKDNSGYFVTIVTVKVKES